MGHVTSNPVIPAQAGIQETEGGLREKALNSYPKLYNIEHPHQGYRSMGSRPAGTVKKCIQPLRNEAYTDFGTQEIR